MHPRRHRERLAAGEVETRQRHRRLAVELQRRQHRTWGRGISRHACGERHCAHDARPRATRAARDRLKPPAAPRRPTGPATAQAPADAQPCIEPPVLALCDCSIRARSDVRSASSSSQRARSRSCRHDDDRRRIWPVVVHDALGRVVEKGFERVMVLLRNRIELVVVARGAADRQSEEHGTRRIRAILDVLKAHFFFDDAVLVGRRVVPDESGCDALIERGIRQQVAGELLDCKLIERQIGVERPDHPVAVRPDAAAIIVVMQAVGVAVARRIEPIARAVLAVVRRGQQSVDHLRVRIRRRVCNERRHVFGIAAGGPSSRATRAG